MCIDVNVQCRLEANYAHQQELDMVPLMVQEAYQPKGWRKSDWQALHYSVADRNIADMEALGALL